MLYGGQGRNLLEQFSTQQQFTMASALQQQSHLTMMTNFGTAVSPNNDN